MFRAFTVDYSNLPPDVNRDILKVDEAKKGNKIDENYDDFMIVQVDGKTISCRPESGLSVRYSMTTDLMELAYYLGVVAGIGSGSERDNSVKVENEKEQMVKLKKENG